MLDMKKVLRQQIDEYKNAREELFADDALRDDQKEMLLSNYHVLLTHQYQLLELDLVWEGAFYEQ